MVTREEVKWRRPSSVRPRAEDKAFLYFKSFQILNLDLIFFLGQKIFKLCKVLDWNILNNFAH
jgi:hypothetical protein